MESWNEECVLSLFNTYHLILTAHLWYDDHGDYFIQWPLFDMLNEASTRMWILFFLLFFMFAHVFSHLLHFHHSWFDNNEWQNIRNWEKCQWISMISGQVDWLLLELELCILVSTLHSFTTVVMYDNVLHCPLLTNTSPVLILFVMPNST